VIIETAGQIKKEEKIKLSKKKTERALSDNKVAAIILKIVCQLMQM